MSLLRLRRAPVCALAFCSALAAAASAAAPAAPSSASAPQTTYQRDRASCLDGASPQGRATCLKEAGAANAEAEHGQLGNGSTAAERVRNALQRCDSVLPADRSACVALARGEGQSSGSVAGGGILKEIVTQVPAAGASAATAPPR
jgi:hypothetical protein